MHLNFSPLLIMASIDNNFLLILLYEELHMRSRYFLLFTILKLCLRKTTAEHVSFLLSSVV